MRLAAGGAVAMHDRPGIGINFVSDVSAQAASVEHGASRDFRLQIRKGAKLPPFIATCLDDRSPSERNLEPAPSWLDPSVPADLFRGSRVAPIFRGARVGRFLCRSGQVRGLEWTANETVSRAS